MPTDLQVREWYARAQMIEAVGATTQGALDLLRQQIKFFESTLNSLRETERQLTTALALNSSMAALSDMTKEILLQEPIPPQDPADVFAKGRAQQDIAGAFGVSVDEVLPPHERFPAQPGPGKTAMPTGGPVPDLSEDQAAQVEAGFREKAAEVRGLLDGGGHDVPLFTVGDACDAPVDGPGEREGADTPAEAPQAATAPPEAPIGGSGAPRKLYATHGGTDWYCPGQLDVLKILGGSAQPMTVRQIIEEYNHNAMPSGRPLPEWVSRLLKNMRNVCDGLIVREEAVRVGKGLYAALPDDEA